MHTISGTSKEFSPEFETALAEYRHKIFIERLGWPLPVENGMERDQFDHPNTHYVVACEPSGAICGCARLLPTTEPYLLGEVFPHMLGGVPVPRTHEVWELSRFAAASTDSNSMIDAPRNTRNLLAAAVKSAAEQGATRLIFVSYLGTERLLHRMGVHAHRAGPPTLVDGKRIFACWIEIDTQTIDALGIAPLEMQNQSTMPPEDIKHILAAAVKVRAITDGLKQT
jgi:acyl homoserine lactone synthase